MTGSIAYVAPTFPARSETFVYREVRALRARGWTVHTASLHPSAQDAELADLAADTQIVYDGSTVLGGIAELLSHPLRSLVTLATALTDSIGPGERLSLTGRAKLLGQALAGLKLARSLRSQGVRHVHCHFAHASATVGMYAARQLNISFSFTGHANDLFQRRALLRRKLNRAAFVACISHWHEGFYQSVSPTIDLSRFEVVRCGVDTGSWRPATIDGGSLVRPRVLTVCRLVEKKGVDTLIRAMGRLPRDTWQLTIAGDGPDRARLESLARETGVADSIRWIGPVDNSRVPSLLAATNLFVLPCRTDSSGDRDGIPVVLMEAMACGVPVVSGDLPAIRELIEHGTSGLLVDGSDDKALAEHMANLAAAGELRQALAASARQRIETEFDLNLNVARLEKLLARAIDTAHERTH